MNLHRPTGSERSSSLRGRPVRGPASGCATPTRGPLLAFPREGGDTSEGDTIPRGCHPTERQTRRSMQGCFTRRRYLGDPAQVVVTATEAMPEFREATPGWEGNCGLPRSASKRLRQRREERRG
jgi:hypothetical protein